jgi:hypothetical protein
METKFTPQQLKRARQATGLDRDDFLFVIENFEALQFEYRCQKGEA